MSNSSEPQEGVGLEPGVWRAEFQIRSYDVDFRRRATAQAICRAFLEAAWNHAEQLGFGFAALASQNRLWVLARLLVEIDVYPRWGEKVRLSTWPRGFSTLFALRDFELHDNSQRRLAAGASSWLVLDAASHRPQRPDKIGLRIPSEPARAAVRRDPGKLATPESAAVALSAHARYSDIDVNEHVNSAKYIGWLLDSYSTEFHQAHSLRSIELNYTGETRWGDTVSIASQQLSSVEFAHSIVRTDQSEVCRALLRWTGETSQQTEI